LHSLSYVWGMNTQPQLIHIRVDDIPLLLGLLLQMKIAELYDREVGDYKTHTGVSGGWMLTIWLAYILSQGDRTKYKVEAWVRQHHAVLMQVTRQHFAPSDFNDNRLSALLKRLSKPRRWARFEAALWEHSVEVYALSPASIGGLVSAHVDSTTACGFHEIVPGGVMQRGHSKDHRPDLGQLQLMTVAMHPFGHLAATDVVPGQTADDGLYLPIIARTRAMIGHTGVLYVGDTKMAALATRGQLAYDGDYYLTVAPRTGEMAQWLPSLIAAAVTGQQQTVVLCNDEDGGAVIGCGYECDRQCIVALPGGAQDTMHEVSFTERVQVIRSDAHQAQQVKGLEERLTKAAHALYALTPAPGRGRRQHVTAESLHEAIQHTLATHRVAGLLNVEERVEEHRETRLVGRGRSGANRPTREVITRRYVITAVARDEAAIATHKAYLGWRVHLTNVPMMISLESCVTHYRGNWRGERNYHRLKSAPLGIGPLFVRKDDQIIGKTSLLTLAARVESMLEFEVARGLHTEEKTMMGLHAGLPKQQTATPTAPTLLAAIVRCEMTLTLILGSHQTTTHLTPLPALLVDVLRYLHLPLTLYSDLWDISTFDISIFGK
jgi:transposase